MKKILFILMTVIPFIYVLPVTACAEPISSGGKTQNESTDKEITETAEKNGESAENGATDAAAFTYEETDGKIRITGLTDDGITEIAVPRDIGGKPVAEIAENAFMNRRDLRGVSVPDCVEKIGGGFLSGCSALYSLTLPFTGAENKTEKGLNDYPFGYVFGEAPYNGGKPTTQYYHADSLDYVESADYCIPESLKNVKITGVRSTLLPYAAFYNCSQLGKITIGEHVDKIGEFAFSGVEGEIAWENPKIETVGEHAFEDYKGVSLVIPDSVRTIEKKGYSSCVNVKSFTVPDSVKNIDVYAFSYCYDLNEITLGKNIEKLCVETFYFCTNLKTVNLPAKLKIIEDGVFDGCKALKKIEIPESVERINANAFKNCLQLKNVDFRDAKGWRYYSLITSGDAFSSDALSDGKTAAKYLTDTFRDFIWEKTPR